MNRSAVPLLFIALVQMRAVAACAEAPASHRGSRITPGVRISATSLPEGEGGVDIGPTLWSMQGYNLRELLARVFELEPSRVELESLNLVTGGAGSRQSAPRFNVSFPLTGEESDEAIQATLLRALERRFKVSAVLQTREEEVYVLTAPNGSGPGLQQTKAIRVSASSTGKSQSSPETDTASELTIESRVCPGLSSAGISGRRATSDRLAAALEDNLNRPVVNETNLTGVYDFRVPEYRSFDQLQALLREQLGIMVKAERRVVQVLTVRPAEPANSVLEAGI